MADYKDKAQVIVKRRKKSMDYWASIYDECAEVYQAVQCRTTPIYKKDKEGRDTTEEDTTRTNVAMPILSIMVRKNVSRMTANPPQLDFIGKNSDAADKLTSWHYMQYDLTNEGETRRKTVMQAEMFGIGVEKLFQDNVVIRRKFRVATKNATLGQIFEYRGEKFDGEDRPLNEREVATALAEIGPEFRLEQEVTKYSGPVSKSVFLGDIHLPPGCDEFDAAEWIIEEYVESPTFFEYWLKQTYTNDAGEEVPVMDAKAVQEMIDEDRDLPQDEKDSLRDRFREYNQLDATHQYDKDIACSKKFKIYECHYKKDGKNWICWVGNETHYLGEMPYPWDFYGQWAYTALVPLPNPVIAIGDSTPRLGRFLYHMLNVNEGQRQDLVTNYMKPLVFTRLGADIADEVQDRGAFREVRGLKGADFQLEQMPQLPQYAWEQSNALYRHFQVLDPASTSADHAGSNTNPMAGRTATVGVLAQREKDSLTQYKIDAMNLFLKKHGQKKLWMLQETMQAPVVIGAKYATEAISMRYGKAAVITLDPFEIQEDWQVEPKAGSTLSIEDEFHSMKAQTLFQMAQSDPETFNKRNAAKAYVQTMRGVDVNQVINPEPEEAPDPLSAVKMSLSVSMPLDKMPAEITNQALEKMGFTPSAELAHRDTLEGIVKIGEAADAAGKLAEPANSKPEGSPESGREEPIRRTLANRV